MSCRYGPGKNDARHGLAVKLFGIWAAEIFKVVVIMNFNLSFGIYRVDQHRKITLTVLLFISPLIVGAIVVMWQFMVQAGDIGVAESIGNFLYYLYAEQYIFLILLALLLSSIPLLFLSASARSSAYIKMDDNGFEYMLPLLARDISNGFCATRKFVPWSEVSGVRLHPGKKSQMKGVKGVPSSRLESAKIEIIANDFQLYLNPYKWLREGCGDHRLSMQEAADLSEDGVSSAFTLCPLMAAFDSFKQSQPVKDV